MSVLLPLATDEADMPGGQSDQWETLTKDE